MNPVFIAISLIVGIAIALACRRRWLITPKGRCHFHVEIWAFSEADAKRQAKRLMLKRGWSGFLLSRK